ncbi:MAG: Wzz/FepE/Etk N-terminal domain-containing protein [Pseudomonadota bacterium]
MNQQQTELDRDDELDFVALCGIIWGYRYLIALFAGSSAVIAIVMALMAKPIYRAEVVVTEVSSSGLYGAASLGGQLGSLANLVGVNVGAGGGTDPEARALLKSRRLAEEFIKRNKLVLELSGNAGPASSLWFAVKHFQDDLLSIRNDKREGTTVIGVEWTDPVKAAQWANDIVRLANELLRTRAMDESKRNIAYLNEQTTHASPIEIQRAVYNLIENETKTLMAANSRVDYAFTIVDPAVAPESRIRPKRSFMVAVGFVAGLGAGIFVALTHHVIRRSRQGVLGASRA